MDQSPIHQAVTPVGRHPAGEAPEPCHAVQLYANVELVQILITAARHLYFYATTHYSTKQRTHRHVLALSAHAIG